MNIRPLALAALLCLTVGLCASCTEAPDSYIDAPMVKWEPDPTAPPEEPDAPELSPSGDAASTETAPRQTVPVSGGDITKDPQYLPSKEETEREDPEYIKKPQPTEESIADTLDTAPLPTFGDGTAQTDGTTATESTAGTSADATSPGSGSASESTATTTAPPPATTTAKPTTTTTAPANGWHTAGGKTYYYSGGKPVTGWQTMSSRKYYFDASGVLQTKFGVDVSTFNGTLDWAKLKADGVQFAIIRLGYRGYGDGGLRLDVQYKANVTNAKKNGVPFGVYFFPQAITVAEAKEEAEFVVKTLKDSGLSPADLAYPVVYDVEDIPGANARGNGQSKAAYTNYTIAFCDAIRKAGYHPAVYANKYWLENKLETSRLTAYDTWLAHYTNTTTYKGPFKMWQYSESGLLPSFGSAKFDFNVSFY